MAWDNDSTDMQSAISAEQPLLFPSVNYPRQPNYSQPDVPNAVRIQLHPDSDTSYRRNNLVDMSNWDNDAAARLRSTAHPSGDVFDCLLACRRPLGLRSPPVRGFTYWNRFRRHHTPFGFIWFVRDPCGIVCLIFTWLLITYAEFVVATVILPRSPSPLFGWIIGVIYHFFTFLAVASHFKAFSTDPGTIPIGNATTEAASYITSVYGDACPPIIRCPKCLCVKPPRAHHCRICFRCVRKMDHHCPWINNCVGEGNQKYFVLFTLYICLQSFFAIYTCVHFIIRCVESDWESCQLDGNLSNTLLGVVVVDFSPFAACAFIFGLIMEALIFGLFTLVMCITQVHSIAHDETGIESLSKGSTKPIIHSRRKNLAVACGSPISWRWFSPFSDPPPVTPVFPGPYGSGDDVVPTESDMSWFLSGTDDPLSLSYSSGTIPNGINSSLVYMHDKPSASLNPRHVDHGLSETLLSRTPVIAL